MKKAIQWAALVLALVSVVGCGETEKSALMRLTKNLSKHAISQQRLELQHMTSSQKRHIYFFRFQYFDQHQIIQSFLDSSPRLSTKTRVTVEQYRDASKEVYEYLDKFIEENRFEMTPSERGDFDTKINACLSLAGKVLQSNE